MGYKQGNGKNKDFWKNIAFGVKCWIWSLGSGVIGMPVRALSLARTFRPSKDQSAFLRKPQVWSCHIRKQMNRAMALCFSILHTDQCVLFV